MERKHSISTFAALGLPLSPQVGDILIVTKNDYQAVAAPYGPFASQHKAKEREGEEGEDDENKRVAMFNGERCEVAAVAADTIDVAFPATLAAREAPRPFSGEGDRLPEGTAFGYAMTAHKTQGSQFKFVILVTAPPDRFVSKVGPTLPRAGRANVFSSSATKANSARALRKKRLAAERCSEGSSLWREKPVQSLQIERRSRET